MQKIVTNVNVLYGDELEVKQDYAVWIKDNKFYKVLPMDQIPNSLPVVDAGGCYLTPGLIDLHVHIMWDGSMDPVATTEKESYEQMIIRAVATCQNYIQKGITTVRDVGSINDIALHVAKSIEQRLIKGPRLIASGKTLTMTGGHDPFWARFCDGPIEVLKATREQIYKNAQVIKVSATGGVYGRTEGESVGSVELNYDELKVICDEAHKFGLKVAAHAIGREGILNALRAGIDTIEHGHFLDEELVKMMEKRGTAWVPTLYVYQQIANIDGIPSYARQKAKEIVKIHQTAFKSFFNRSVLIGAGSDAGSPATPHPSLIEELLTMNKLVSNPKNVLKTATINAGKIIGKKVGKVQEGYLADFVLVEGNPLQNLKSLYNVNQVFLGGNEVS